MSNRNHENNEISRKIDFIGVGSAKSASTWIAYCLEEHPDIIFSKEKSKKELRFFNTAGNHAYKKDNLNNYDKGIDWYLEQFPPHEEGKVRGEFSISYLTDDEAPMNIKKHFPNVKILVILRHPVKMLYSLFWFCKATVEYDVEDTFEEFSKNKGYMDRGMYYKHLKKFYDIFPAENIKVLFQDDVKTDPISVVRELYGFLGIDDTFVPKDISKKIAAAYRNRSGKLKKLAQSCLNFVKSLGFENAVNSKIVTHFIYRIYMRINLVQRPYPPLSENTKRKLTKYFLEDIENLEKLLDRDLSTWKTI